ncbi:MAG: hypothetical protein AAFR17_19295 [Pseudomonadota bacterium]
MREVQKAAITCRAVRRTRAFRRMLTGEVTRLVERVVEPAGA